MNQEKEKLHAWQNLAQQMDFTWREGIQGFLDSPERKKMIIAEQGDKGLHKLESLLENPFLKHFIKTLHIYALDGYYKDRFVTIFPHFSHNQSSSSRKHETNIAMFFHHPLNMGLKIRKSDLWHKIALFFSSGKYINIPDQKILCQSLAIQADKKTQAEITFADQHIANMLLELFERDFPYPVEIMIEDYGVRLKMKAQILSQAEIVEVLSSLYPIVNKFS